MLFYLVPGLSDALRDIGASDHFQQKLDAHIAALQQQTHYVYKNDDTQARIILQQLDALLHDVESNMMYDMQQRQTRYDMRVIEFLASFQDYAHQRVAHLQETIAHLNRQYYKSFYYHLYKNPYGLKHQRSLPQTPTACVPDALSVILNTDPAADHNDIMTRLQQCSLAVTRHYLKPIIALFNDHHLYLKKQQWWDSGLKLIDHKAHLTRYVEHNLTRKKAFEQARLLKRLQSQDNASSAESHMHAYLLKSYSTYRKYAFSHWVADTFADIPLEQKLINYVDEIVQVKPQQACNKKLRQFSDKVLLDYHIPTTWMYSAYCSAVQSIIDQRHHTQSIAYAPEKDPLLQHFEQVQTQLIDDAAQFNPQQYIQQRIQHGFDLAEVQAQLQPEFDAITHIYDLCLSSAYTPNQCAKVTIDTDTTSATWQALQTLSPQVEVERMTIAHFKQQQPLLWQPIAAWVTSYADNSTRPLDTDLLRHVLHLYPLNQSWYIEDHYQALGHFAPYFIYQTQLKKDALQRMQIIQGSKVILPLELHHLTDSNLWDQQMRKMQADLAGKKPFKMQQLCL